MAFGPGKGRSKSSNFLNPFLIVLKYMHYGQKPWDTGWKNTGKPGNALRLKG
jgi:hypothetical protein